jgi:type VI secretion system secreted protein VgrG
MVANMGISHTAENITFTASNEIMVNAGGSYTRWSASGIESGTAGTWLVHANQHAMDGPQSLPVVMPTIPSGTPRVRRPFSK